MRNTIRKRTGILVMIAMLVISAIAPQTVSAASIYKVFTENEVRAYQTIANNTRRTQTATRTKKTHSSSSQTVTGTVNQRATRTENKPAKTKTTSRKMKVNQTVALEQTTITKTLQTYYYTKNSKRYRITTRIETTIRETIKVSPAGSTAATTVTTMERVAPKLPSNVKTAWNSLGFKVIVDSRRSDSLCDIRKKTIYLQMTSGEHAYHEFGHFVAFVAGNYDSSSKFRNIYNSEKSKYTGYNKAYVTQNYAEYFAESFSDYIQRPAALRTQRPKTYQAIVEAISMITTSRINRAKLVLS